jgi:glycosyltransferase involved in cell wall biosynthesis
MARVMDRLREGGVDLVHDHLEVVGPAVLAAAGDGVPPVLQTLHWDLRKHPGFYESFDGRGRVRFVGVSESQVARAPAALRAQTLGAIPLAVAVEAMPFESRKDGPFLVLGRLCKAKGPDVALRLCAAGGHPLELAGPVAGLPDAAALARALAEPGSGFERREDVAYFRAEVEPRLAAGAGRWLGTLAGAEKLERLSRARALLAPVRWAEPGGTAIVEALACGTPVIGMRRGALTSLVEHGVTGFLADTEAELAGYLDRAGEIDPAACRRAAEERFSADAMAEAYLDRYAEVIRSAPGRGPRRPARPAPPAGSGAPGRPAPAGEPGPPRTRRRP